MRSLAILLSISLILWNTQGITQIAVDLTNYQEDLIPDHNEHEDVEINDAIEVAISNSDAELNRLSVDSVVTEDAEPEDSYEASDYYKHSPVNGNFSSWHMGKCSKKCGGGVETSTRICNNPFPAFGGKQCLGCISQVKTCNTKHCPTDGQWSAWTEPKCSKTCGGGTQRKARKCNNPAPQHGGKNCVGVSHSTLPCNANPCPIDGGWSPWKQGTCSKACGGGKITKTRTCTNPPPKYKGRSCIGDESVTASCNDHHCPINGNWSPFGEYGKCSKSCEGGVRWKSRQCNNPTPRYHGKSCKGVARKSAVCNAHPCPKYSCSKPIDFVILLDCSGMSHVAWKKQVKFVERMVDTMYRKFSGARVSLIKYCTQPHSIISFTRVENYLKIKSKFRALEGLVPKVSNKRRTDLGLQSAFTMFRDHARSASFKSLLLLTSGHAVGRSSKIISKAQINEVVTRLRKASVYTTVVGFGFEKLGKTSRKLGLSQIREIGSSKQHVFIRRYDELTSRDYHKHHVDDSFCPVDGAWSPWSEGKCTKKCGGGTRTKTRSCTDPAPKSGGNGCLGGETDKLPCNVRHCPVDGHWSKWEETRCSATCGGGKKSRSRSCVGQAYGGASCKGKTSEVVDCKANPCPIAGGWSAWSSTSCSKSCGGGTITKTRTCTNPKPKYKGKECDGLKEKVIACNQHYCPIDGNWSPWKDGSCSKSCGGGNYKKTRLCNNPKPQYGGTVCPGKAMEQLTCNTDPCPINGGWSKWSDGVCSKICGGGRKTRKRTCTNPAPQYHGKSCSTLLAGDTKELSCNDQLCPIDGNWGSWSEGSCSKTCGGGVKKAVRLCNAPKPMNHGKECVGIGSKTLSCKSNPCPVDGNWSSFKSFTQCSKSCGGGVKSRTRTCSNPAPAHGGKDCPGKGTQTRKCNPHKCPIDGNWSPWKETSCSKTCGGGSKKKLRWCNNPKPQFKGKECEGNSVQKLSCNDKPCPINGKWSSWTKPACSKTCGGGSKSRSRTCTNPPPAHGGNKCQGLVVQNLECNTHHCPVDGKWSPWSDAKCNKKCNGGTLTRTRQCDNPSPKYKGKQCSGKPFHTENCNEHPCPKYICHKPLDLIIALDYSNSVTRENWKKQCAFAIKLVTAAFREHPQVHVGVLHFGTTAVLDLKLTDNAGSFVYIRNKLRQLSKIYPKGGSQEWTRTDLGLKKAFYMFKNDKRKAATKILAVLTDGYASGPKLNYAGKVIGETDVPDQTLVYYRSHLKAIGVHVLTVGFGMELILNAKLRQNAIADVKLIATYHDMAFIRSYVELLNKQKLSLVTRSLCPVNGGFSAWEENECTKSCGGGTKLFTRTCTLPKPKYGGRKCRGRYSRTEKCNVKPCPIDGGWTQWKTSECTVTCGGGTQIKSRSCTKPAPRHGGKKCLGSDKESLECKTNKCPIDGHWTDWARSSCTKPCGGGKETQTRSCSNPPPRYGGKNCIGVKLRRKNCNEKPCPIDGNWSHWAPVSKCSRTCGGGRQVIERSCSRPSPKYGGKVCSGSNKNNVGCKEQPCPVDGGWSRWVVSQCSKSCGGGSKVRTRTCTEPAPRHGGKFCQGDVKEDIDCKTQQCPIDGQWSPWKSGQCSKSCGGGVNINIRTCNKPSPQYGGKYCKGRDSKQIPCNQQHCPIDGNWSPWIVGSCSRTCGGGLKKSTRRCSNPAPLHNGKGCVGLKEKDEECKTNKCPVDGKWTSWSEFGKCTKSCGVGKKERTRTCSNPAPAYGGKGCEGEIKEIAECNTQLCKLCKQFTCKGCNCNGVQYPPKTTFATPNCKRKCICLNNHVRCKPLCPVVAHTGYCPKKNSYFTKQFKAYAHGRKACYCYLPKCVSSCPKRVIQPL